MHHSFSGRHAKSISDLLGDVQLKRIADHSEKVDESSPPDLKRPRSVPSHPRPTRIIVICGPELYHQEYSDEVCALLSQASRSDLTPSIINADEEGGPGWMMADPSDLGSFTKDEHCAVFSFPTEDAHDDDPENPEVYAEDMYPVDRQEEY